MPLCTSSPIIHKGPSVPGPSVLWALRAGAESSGKDPKKQRPGWDQRHQVTWQNDAQNVNMRSYFDRSIGRVDLPVCPRPKIRPTWSLDVPEEDKEFQVYRIFDAKNASWKEQAQWAPLKLDGSAPQVPQPLLHSGSMPSVVSSQTKPRTPPIVVDLKMQRHKEKDWDRKHAVLFSKDNDSYQVNVRSYFDRWRDTENYGTVFSREPSWRLGFERKPLLVRSASESTASSRPGWQT
mmetsp:Transcript_2406/g.5365  ORF Transcript_2406/g.5365 Transcript_2406/m.5365 type:complete len:236 (+) Transcript_2406:68-775(+)